MAITLEKVFDTATIGMVGTLLGLSVSYVSTRVQCGRHEQKLKDVDTDYKAVVKKVEANDSKYDSLKDDIRDGLHDVKVDLAQVLTRLNFSLITEEYKDAKKEQLRFLIVEDKEANADIFIKLFHQKSIECDVVKTYVRAEEALKEYRYDLVLTDDDLGGMRTGRDLWSYCKTEYPRRPVIVYSGRGNDELLIPPSMKFIEKPVDHSVLFHLIEECGIKV